MWPIKTKAEILDEYNIEIEKLEDIIHMQKREIERNQSSIARYEKRIEDLKETAKLFE